MGQTVNKVENMNTRSGGKEEGHKVGKTLVK